MLETIIADLVELPDACIFVLYNQDKGKAHLALCKNGLLRIPRLINELRKNEHKIKELCEDLGELQLKVLETHEDYETLRLHMNFWYNYIEDLGLETYSKRRTYIKYKSRINIGYDYNGDRRVFVELVNRRNESFVVGVFEKMFEGRDFKKQYFDSKDYVYPVYANNELTKNYVERKSLELTSVFKVRF